MSQTPQGSDHPQGNGWWQASDGRWYAPELHPDAAADPGPMPSSEAGGAPSAPPTVVVAGSNGDPVGSTTSPPPASSAAGPTSADQPSAQPAADDPTASSQPPSTPPPGAPPPGQGGEPTPPSPPGGSVPGSPPPGGGPPGGPPPGGPPGGPPPGGPPPGGPPGNAKPKRGGRIFVIIGLVLLLALGAFAASVFVFGDEAAADVILEPVGDAGESPFTDPVAADPAGSLADYAAAGSDLEEVAVSGDGGYRTADGSVPGIYGGSLNEQACDVDLLRQFLEAETERAEAWASVLEIAPQDIGSYLDGLTSVHLGADARVVNHGFEDGEAVARDSVLQRGTAVLIDDHGVPRVNCYSGSPLRQAEPVGEESFSDGGWESFDAGHVLVIDRSPEPVEQFEIEDIETGELFTRPAGTSGEADRSGTVDLIDDGPIELNTRYDDTLFEGRDEVRYLFDVPDGAILTVSVSNQRDSEHSLDTRVATGGDTLVQQRRLSPGDDLEAVVVRGHDGGGEFEIEFSRGPAAFEFEVALDRQQDAGQDGDAGDSFDTAFQIEPGQTYEGLLGGQDEADLFLLDLQPGTELQLQVDADRDNEGRFDVAVSRDGDTLLRNRRMDPGESYSDEVLFSGDDDGVLEISFSLRGSDLNRYRFTAELVEQEDGGQPGDAGDARTETREVPVGEQLAGWIGDFDGDDFYHFEATAEMMEVEVVNDPTSDGRIDVLVEDDNTNTLDRARRVDPGQEAVLSFETEPGSEHVLHFSDRGRANYTFEIREAADD